MQNLLLNENDFEDWKCNTDLNSYCSKAETVLIKKDNQECYKVLKKNLIKKEKIYSFHLILNYGRNLSIPKFFYKLWMYTFMIIIWTHFWKGIGKEVEIYSSHSYSIFRINWYLFTRMSLLFCSSGEQNKSSEIVQFCFWVA